MAINNVMSGGGYRVRTVQRNTTNTGDLLIYDGDFTTEAAEKLIGAFVTLESSNLTDKLYGFLKDGYALTFFESSGGLTTGYYSSLCREDTTAGTLTYNIAFSVSDSKFNGVPAVIDIVEKV